jgi:hypothetical protein
MHVGRRWRHCCSRRARAQTFADTTLRVAFSGFVDSYFAYDVNHPRTLDRPFTQAARHDEFNINLAFLDATLSGPRLRGRFAAQFGTSVQARPVCRAAGESRAPRSTSTCPRRLGCSGVSRRVESTRAIPYSRTPEAS